MSPAPSTTTAAKKAVARVGLFGLDSASAHLLRDCFRQFGIETVAVTGDIAKRMNTEKFAGCVVPLDARAELVLQAMRSSPSNQRAVIYALAASAQEAMRYSKYGLNAVLQLPLERSAALKVVRGTYFLVLHEFRRYVRVPMTTEVKVLRRGGDLTGITLEISGGGMSTELGGKPELNETVELSFSLPGEKPIRVNAVVCWVEPKDRLAGFRFDLADSRRETVKKWIEDYLEIA